MTWQGKQYIRDTLNAIPHTYLNLHIAIKKSQNKESWLATYVPIALESFKQWWELQDAGRMLICASEHVSDAVLLGPAVYIKGGPDWHNGN